MQLRDREASQDCTKSGFPSTTGKKERERGEEGEGEKRKSVTMKVVTLLQM